MIDFLQDTFSYDEHGLIFWLAHWWPGSDLVGQNSPGRGGWRGQPIKHIDWGKPQSVCAVMHEISIAISILFVHFTVMYSHNVWSIYWWMLISEFIEIEIWQFDPYLIQLTLNSCWHKAEVFTTVSCLVGIVKQLLHQHHWFCPTLASSPLW